MAKNDGRHLKQCHANPPSPPPWRYVIICSPFLYKVGIFLRFIDFMISAIVESFRTLSSAALRLSKPHFSAISGNNWSASFTSKNFANRLSSPIVFCLKWWSFELKILKFWIASLSFYVSIELILHFIVLYLQSWMNAIHYD